MPHLATTYAAVNSIVTLGGQKALSSINRWSLFFYCSFKNSPFLTTLQLQFSELIQLLFNLSFRDKLYNFLLRMKDPSGAFRCDFKFVLEVPMKLIFSLISFMNVCTCICYGDWSRISYLKLHNFEFLLSSACLFFLCSSLLFLCTTLEAVLDLNFWWCQGTCGGGLKGLGIDASTRLILVRFHI